MKQSLNEQNYLKKQTNKIHKYGANFEEHHLSLSLIEFK